MVEKRTSLLVYGGLAALAFASQPVPVLSWADALIRHPLSSGPSLAHSARRHGQQEQTAAARPQLGAVPTVQASGPAWVVVENGRRDCRAVIGRTYHASTFVISVTRYGARDCTPALADLVPSARALIDTLP